MPTNFLKAYTNKLFAVYNYLIKIYKQHVKEKTGGTDGIITFSEVLIVFKKTVFS